MGVLDKWMCNIEKVGFRCANLQNFCIHWCGCPKKAELRRKGWNKNWGGGGGETREKWKRYIWGAGDLVWTWERGLDYLVALTVMLKLR